MKLISIPDLEFLAAPVMTASEWVEWYRAHGIEPKLVKSVRREEGQTVYEVEEWTQ